ncbi:MAG: toll/interleukin-1 receptor domain-containing protein [Candidatus Acidiferrales bacterium]
MARRAIPPKGPDWPPEKTLPFLKEQLLKLQEFKGKTLQEVGQTESEWEQFTRSVIIHGFGEDSQNLSNFYMARNAGIYNMMGISDHQRQLNFEERTTQFESTLKSSIRELEATISVPVSNPPAASARPSGTPIASDSDQPLVLISHSSKDVELASALVDFLRAGLLINKIRCSSVDGFRLPAGVHTDSQLREEVNRSNVLIGLITPNSLASAYVMFELGARWGAGSFMIPLLAGVTTGEIRGPLSGLNALCANNDSQLHQLLTDVAKTLGITVQNPASYASQLSVVRARSGDKQPSTRLVYAETIPVSAKEQRQREIVERKIQKLTKEARDALRIILENGRIHSLALEEELRLNPIAAQNAEVQCFTSGLVDRHADRFLSVIPEFREALEAHFQEQTKNSS